MKFSELELLLAIGATTSGVWVVELLVEESSPPPQAVKDKAIKIVDANVNNLYFKITAFFIIFGILAFVNFISYYYLIYCINTEVFRFDIEYATENIQFKMG